MASLLFSTRTFLCLFVLLCFFSGGTGWAQVHTLQIPPGTRIRITAPDVSPRKLTGDMMETNAESLLLAQGPRGKLMWIPLTSVGTLEVSRGQSTDRMRGVLRGVLLGGGLGVAFGALAGLATYEKPKGTPFLDFGPEVAALGGAILGGGAGALFGGVLGALNPGEMWERVPLPARMSIAPSGNGLALSASIGF